ncbi:ATP-binding cassette domain-containing protein [Methanogenium cariaci]|uniref:ATP-binding cassette domain-containing protein n=1 Tax=Methanogenium cariaci TaxID=2197 RepID=UPI00155D8F3C|nr:ATP-binding cassette domain-containing protein [Methanogenium cariaci]
MRGSETDKHLPVNRSNLIIKGPYIMEEEIIRYDEVSVVFDRKTVIEHFSLGVCKGEKVILRGGISGSGKSSLLKMAQGYVRPYTGTVSYRKHEIDAATAWHIRQETAYVSQDTDIGGGGNRQGTD